MYFAKITTQLDALFTTSRKLLLHLLRNVKLLKNGSKQRRSVSMTLRANLRRKVAKVQILNY